MADLLQLIVQVHVINVRPHRVIVQVHMINVRPPQFKYTFCVFYHPFCPNLLNHVYYVRQGAMKGVTAPLKKIIQEV